MPIGKNYHALSDDRWFRIQVNETERITKCYRQLLYRTPSREEIARVLMLEKSESAKLYVLRSSIVSGIEFTQIVTPLRSIVEEAFQAVVFRRPTHEELCHHICHAREQCGTDDETMRAIRNAVVRQRLGLRPVNIELDLTNRCNLRCVMCLHSHRTYYSRPRRDMTVKRFSQIADTIFPFARCASLSYGTEPLMHPQFEQIVEIATRHAVPKLYINTNGLLLNESIVTIMAQRGFHHLGVSIDAATKGTYERIRVGAKFETLLENLRMVNRVRSRLGSALPELSLLFVMMRSNIHELPDFIDLAREHGARAVNAIHMTPYSLLDNADQTAASDKALCNQMVREARRRAQRYGIALVTPPEFVLESAVQDRDQQRREGPFDLAKDEHHPGDIRCTFPWHFIGLDAQGDVVPCGWWHGQSPMGNIYESDILSIWGNERFKTLRDELERGEVPEVCRTCPAAGVGDPNDPLAFVSR